MVDSGAQVSLVNTKVLDPNTFINTERKVQITSIHGKENTLGEVSANLVYNSFKIPVKLQALKNCPVNEDGILGYDVLKSAIINGPEEKLTWTTPLECYEVPMKMRYGSGVNLNFTGKDEQEVLKAIDDGKYLVTGLSNIASKSLDSHFVQEKDNHSEVQEMCGDKLRNARLLLRWWNRLGKLIKNKRNRVRSQRNSRCTRKLFKKETTGKKLVNNEECGMSILKEMEIFETECELTEKMKNVKTIVTEISEEQIGLNLDKQFNKYSNTEIPPRTAVHVLVAAQAEDVILVEPQECSDGVFVAGCLTNAKNGSAWIRIANTNPFSVQLKNPEIKYSLFKEECPESSSQQKFVHCVDSSQASEKSRFNLLLKETNIDDNWYPEERKRILHLCEDFQHLFYLKGDLLTHTHSIMHKIETDPDIYPIYLKNYRLPNAHKDIINEHIRELLEGDIIVPSNSPWNSPLLVVPKKSGKDNKPKYRIVVDFRKLNEKTKGDAYPLPRIDDILDQLKDAQYFSTLDLASGYHQVLVDPQDRQKTAFSTSFGHFEFKRMPFGLKGAPATFQRLMNQVLLGLQGIQCFVYLDDIVTFSKTLDEHITKLRTVFERLQEANLKLQPQKCFFLQKEIVYLGHLCGVNGCQPDPSKVEAIDKITPPQNLREIQSFLGIMNPTGGLFRAFPRLLYHWLT